MGARVCKWHSALDLLADFPRCHAFSATPHQPGMLAAAASSPCRSLARAAPGPRRCAEQSTLHIQVVIATLSR